jgi:lipoprotein-anchoring transpeptidase ErfK/SrfK
MITWDNTGDQKEAPRRRPRRRVGRRWRAPSPSSSLSWLASRRRAKVPRHSGNGRRVVYSITRQRVWLIGGAGRVQHSYLVSGRLSQPEPGHYRIYSKSRWTSSTVTAETMQYMVRFTHGENTGTPIGFHSIPRDHNGHPAQSLDDLGKPVSHGCIRQRLRDAAYHWHFVPVGTKVVVTH